MSRLKLLTVSELKNLVPTNTKEPRIGEFVQLFNDSTPIYEQLLNLDVDHVIFGIPEHIGVFANSGKQGGEKAWSFGIQSFLNLRDNQKIHAERIAVLGHLDFKKEISKLDTLNPSKSSDIKKARGMVKKIDNEVSQLVHDIVKSGKKPIIISGGHHNAYGNLKGSSLALNQHINALNFDAHADFGPEDGRHNGNGFSYAFDEGFLDRYFIFGMHENYLPKHMAKVLGKLNKRIQFNTLEDLMVRRKLKLRQERQRALEFIGNKAFGIELDCDVMANVPGVAMSPAGFTLNKMRELIYNCSRHKNARYFHICGVAPELASKRQVEQTGKLIAYLISDFVRV
ncbi:MAG: formimidoylglutamase [Flavobacteriaceae bacterium]|nr:formimidoylglutamase [Flavobacteriaceae bacterium]